MDACGHWQLTACMSPASAGSPDGPNPAHETGTCTFLPEPQVDEDLRPLPDPTSLSSPPGTPLPSNLAGTQEPPRPLPVTSPWCDAVAGEAHSQAGETGQGSLSFWAVLRAHSSPVRPCPATRPPHRTCWTKAACFSQPRGSHCTACTPVLSALSQHIPAGQGGPAGKKGL